MSKIDLLDQKWIDLVFEGRNEAYGAYQIRRDTGRRNLMGLIFMLLGIAVIWGGAMGVSKVSEAIAASKEHETVVELEAVEEEVPEEEEEIEIVYQQEELEQLVEQQEVMNSEKFTAYEAEDEVKPEEQTKTQDEMAESTTAVGALDFDQGSDEAEHVLQLDEKVVDKKPEVVEEQKIFDVVEQQPTFPGGDPRVWIGNNIHYPPVAEENGVQGTVVCQFVVETDGSISNVTVARGADPSLDKEAVRVIKSMPKWVPGKQNGRNVRVKYTIPVKFQLQ
ncbi:MAG: TonB family protein [Prevotella sp.]|nr:TonB family protein [Prevotella sp.]